MEHEPAYRRIVNALTAIDNLSSKPQYRPTAEVDALIGAWKKALDSYLWRVGADHANLSLDRSRLILYTHNLVMNDHGFVLGTRYVKVTVKPDFWGIAVDVRRTDGPRWRYGDREAWEDMLHDALTAPVKHGFESPFKPADP